MLKQYNDNIYLYPRCITDNAHMMGTVCTVQLQLLLPCDFKFSIYNNNTSCQCTRLASENQGTCFWTHITEPPVGEVLKVSTLHPNSWVVLCCKPHLNSPQVNCWTCHCQHTCWPALPLSLRCQGSATTQNFQGQVLWLVSPSLLSWHVGWVCSLLSLYLGWSYWVPLRKRHRSNCTARQTLSMTWWFCRLQGCATELWCRLLVMPQADVALKQGILARMYAWFFPESKHLTLSPIGRFKVNWDCQ